MENSSTKDLLHYDVCAISSILTRDFFQQPPGLWFSLKEAYRFYAPMTDVVAARQSNSDNRSDQIDGSICKLLASELRKQRLYVAARVWIGGGLQSSVWRTEVEYLRFITQRASIPSGTRGASPKQDFDLSRKWTPGETS